LWVEFFNGGAENCVGKEVAEKRRKVDQKKGKKGHSI